jgi:hypothetical protein
VWSGSRESSLGLTDNRIYVINFWGQKKKDFESVPTPFTNSSCLSSASVGPCLFRISYYFTRVHRLKNYQMVSALWRACSEGNLENVFQLLKDASTVDIEIKGKQILFFCLIHSTIPFLDTQSTFTMANVDFSLRSHWTYTSHRGGEEWPYRNCEGSFGQGLVHFLFLLFLS